MIDASELTRMKEVARVAGYAEMHQLILEVERLQVYAEDRLAQQRAVQDYAQGHKHRADNAEAARDDLRVQLEDKDVAYVRRGKKIAEVRAVVDDPKVHATEIRERILVILGEV